MAERVCATRVDPFNLDKSVNVKFIDELNRVDKKEPILRPQDLELDKIQSSEDGLVLTFPFSSGKIYQVHVKRDAEDKLFYEIFKIASKPLPSALQGVTARPASGGVMFQPSSAFEESCTLDAKRPEKIRSSDEWLDHETKDQKGYLYGVKKNERKFLSKIRKLAKEKHLDNEETHELLVSSLKEFRKGKRDRVKEASGKIQREVTKEVLAEMFPGYRSEKSGSQDSSDSKPRGRQKKKS